MSWRMRGAALVAAALALLGPWQARADAAMDAKIEALVPDLEAYIAKGMADFHVPGVAIGIVSGDRLVWSEGFGVAWEGGPPVDAATVFQVGSTTKAFLATTLAIGVDRDKLAWDDRVVDLYPEFQLQDPWVTREFRVFDLLAQRSGLPPAVNDMLGFVGFDEAAMIRSLRHVEPTTSFRSAFTYTNVTHMLAGRVLAQAMGAADWPTLVETEILAPLGMTDTSLTAEAMEAAAKGTRGYVWTPDKPIEVPFIPEFPYAFAGAGAINSTVDDMAKWVRLLLADGSFEGEPIVSAPNLAVTRIPRIGLAPQASYAMGWLLQSTPNGQITWHNGGTTSYGAYVGTLLDKDVGVIVLTNLTNVGLPDAVGEWTLDRLLGNPEVDHAATKLAAARAAAADVAATYTRPAEPMAAPPLDALTGDFAEPSFGTSVARPGRRAAGRDAVDGSEARLRAVERRGLRRQPRPRGPVRADRRQPRAVPGRLRDLRARPGRQGDRLPSGAGRGAGADLRLRREVAGSEPGEEGQHPLLRHAAAW